MAEFEGKELGWDESVEKGEGTEFVLLPEGDYDYVVESFERARHGGSEKVPPCHKAVIKLRIHAPEGTSLLTENLLLYDTLQWKLAEFFLSIGENEVDGKVRMNWSTVTGATGRASVGVKPGRNDPSKKYNFIKRFLPKEAKKFEPGRF